MPKFYDRQGRPLTLQEWLDLFENRVDRVDGYGRVALTKVTDGIEVSTVWIGLDQGDPWLSGPPLIFETMVFLRREEPIEVFGRTSEREGTEVYRWPTELAAIEGHVGIVRELASNLALDHEPVTEVYQP